MYTPEMMEKMGEIYQEMLYVLNKKGNDPYWQISDRYPLKCITMLIPRAISCGISQDLNLKISELMSSISLDDMPKLLEKSIPMELTLCFEKGKLKASKKG